MTHLEAATARRTEAEAAAAAQDWNGAAVGYTLAKEQYQHLRDAANAEAMQVLAIQYCRRRDGKL